MNQSHGPDDRGQQPPVDRSLNLATFKRAKYGTVEELRVGLDTYNGYDYVSIRLWIPGQSGAGLWPSAKTGCSIRRNEVLNMISALQMAAVELGLADGERQPQERRERVDATVDATAIYRGPAERRKVDPSELDRLKAGQGRPSVGFDECERS